VDSTAPILPIIVIVMITVGLTIVAILGATANSQRREALAAWAHSHSWSFDPGDDDIHDAEFPQFDIFQRGSRRHGLNTTRGVATICGRPFPIKCGDYQYTVSNGKSSTTHTFSYLILTLPFPNVPGLDIRRENLLDRLAGALGFQDINFESEEFSRRFFVKCSERKFAYDVITPKMMDFLLQSNPPPIHISNGQICLTNSDSDSKWDPQAFERHLAWAGQFFSLWPDYYSPSPREGAGG
jgi:hypothetical protein